MTTLILGDSNIYRLQDFVGNHWATVEFYPVSGLRAVNLGGYENLFTHYQRVIISVGHNDLVDHPYKKKIKVNI